MQRSDGKNTLVGLRQCNELSPNSNGQYLTNSNGNYGCECYCGSASAAYEAKEFRDLRGQLPGQQWWRDLVRQHAVHLVPILAHVCYDRTPKPAGGLAAPASLATASFAIVVDNIAPGSSASVLRQLRLYVRLPSRHMRQPR